MDAIITLSSDEMDRERRARWHGYLADSILEATGIVVQVRYDGGAMRDRFEGFEDADDARALLDLAWESFCEIEREEREEREDAEHFATAGERVRVVPFDRERELYAHWCDAARAWTVVHRYALCALGSALVWDRGRPADEREGDGAIYSRWCTGDFGHHRSEAAPEGWAP